MMRGQRDDDAFGAGTLQRHGGKRKSSAARVPSRARSLNGQTAAPSRPGFARHLADHRDTRFARDDRRGREGEVTRRAVVIDGDEAAIDNG